MTDDLSFIHWIWARIRRWASHGARMFGARLHAWHLDLALALMPKRDREPIERGPVWPAIVVIALLVLGLVAAGAVGVVAIHEALPHRESRP